MANSIIGAFYIGLFTATVGPGTPTDGLAAQALPQPKCVLCGPARRDHVARVYDWSNGRVKASHQPRPWKIPAISIRDLMLEQRLDMTSQQVERMTHYTGV